MKITDSCPCGSEFSATSVFGASVTEAWRFWGQLHAAHIGVKGWTIEGDNVNVTRLAVDPSGSRATATEGEEEEDR